MGDDPNHLLRGMILQVENLITNQLLFDSSSIVRHTQKNRVIIWRTIDNTGYNLRKRTRPIYLPALGQK